MNERYLALMCALALAACGGEAEIGSGACFGDGVRCETERSEPSPPEQGAPAVAVSPRSLTRLEHASTLEPLAEHGLFAYELVVDRAGTLWEFGLQFADENARLPRRGEGRLRVRTTSLTGEVQENSVEPPAELPPDTLTAMPPSVRSSERGPIVDITWIPRDCLGTSDCTRSERLGFGSDGAMLPEHSKPNTPSGLAPQAYFVAQAKERWTSVDSGRTIEQRTGSGELVWRQTAVQLEDYTVSNDTIELLDSGELTFLAYAPDLSPPPELWRIGFDGNVKSRIQLDQLEVVPARPTVHSPAARLAHDSQHRAWMTGVGGDGMLALRYEGGDTLRTWSFLRTQYNELTVFANSFDLADTLYLLTESGEREESERVPVLCRVRGNDAADCFVLDQPEETMGRPLRRMQATGPGIVYIGDGQRLFRYELPKD